MPEFEEDIQEDDIQAELSLVDSPNILEVTDSLPEVSVSEKGSKLNKLLNYREVLQDRMYERLQETLRGFGEIGIRAAATFKSPDLSMAQKGEGALAAGVDGVAQILETYLKYTTGPGLLVNHMPDRVAKPLDAFTEGFVRAAANPVVERKEDGTYGFKELGVVNYVNPKGLVGLGVSSVVGGVGDALRTSAEYEKANNPDSKASKIMGSAQRAFESPAGTKLTGIVESAATKKINTKLKL